MDRGPADVSCSGVLRKAHHLVFISKAASENLDVRAEELIKKAKSQQRCFLSDALVGVIVEAICNLLDIIPAPTS